MGGVRVRPGPASPIWFGSMPGGGSVGIAVLLQEVPAGLTEFDDPQPRGAAGPQGFKVVDGGLDATLLVLPGTKDIQVLEVLDQSPGGLVGGAGEADVVAGVIREDASLGVEEPAGVTALSADPDGQLDLQEPRGGKPGQGVEPILDQRVFDLGKRACGDAAQHPGGILLGPLQGGDVVRLQVWRDHQAHASTPQGQTGDAAGSQGEASAGKISRGSAVEHGGFEAGDKKVPYQVVPTRAVAELEGEVRQIGHCVGGNALSGRPNGRISL